jgi:hypothetical protein
MESPKTESIPRSGGLAVFALAGMVFLGAFLLFVMEPMVGRLLAPSFGGAVHVWLLCLIFFQFMLLAGYLYAHLTEARFGAWHILLLFLPLISMPLQITEEVSSNATAWNLIAVLINRTSLPLAVLSTTVVMAQVWLTRSRIGARRNPYLLYGASNAGAMLGLLSYPFGIEPLIGLRIQGRLWLAGYLLYLFLAILSYVLLRPAKFPMQAGIGHGSPSEQTPPPSWRIYAQWGLLSALSSAFLLTVTNLVAMELGSFPMVWIPPLVLYLASFIFTFREKASRAGKAAKFWPEVLLVGGLLYVLSSSRPLFIFGHLLVLFLVCLFIHGELYRSRPDRLHLSGFYLAVAAGGFAGGAVITLGAPLMFPGLYEYPFVLLALAAILTWRDRNHAVRFPQKARLPVRLARGAALAALAGSLIFFSSTSLTASAHLIHRNYYGITRVADTPPSADAPAGVRMLIHSSTLHGIQYLDETRRRLPALYYDPASGLSDVFDFLRPPRQISVVGLGAGVVGAYTRQGDRLAYYEIDPDMEGIARKEFTYLRDTLAEVLITVGDGRLAMKKPGAPGVRDDLIFIDAFSGDGIPTHLLTQEALRLYMSRLKEKGILLFHLSNRHYDLRPVIKATANSLGIRGAVKVRVRDRSETRFPVHTVYAAFSRNAGTIASLIERGWTPFDRHDGLPECRAWSDDYVNLLIPVRENRRNRFTE